MHIEVKMDQPNLSELEELFKQWDYERLRNHWKELADLYGKAIAKDLYKENPFLKLIPKEKTDKSSK